jgi:hypothetical protein
MHYTITRHGVPLGELEVTRPETVTSVDFQPLPAYATVSDVVSEARRAMRGELFALDGSVPAQNAAFEHALAEWRALNAELQLRDVEGQLVPTSAIELLDEEEASPYWRWTATIVFADAVVGEPAMPSSGSGDGSEEHEVPSMRCTDCRARDATVVWVQGTGIYSDVRRKGDLEAEEIGEAARVEASASESFRRGPNLCEACAELRYEASRPAGAPSWAEFTHRSNRSASRPAP